MTHDQRITVKATIRRYRIAKMQSDKRLMNTYRSAVYNMLRAYRKAA